MDTPKPSLTVSYPNSAQSHSHLSLSHCSRAHSSVRTPIGQTPQQINISPSYTSSARKYSSPKLRQLISKFEALDADSLTFNIRDAQPPHLRLPGSRMGRCGQVADARQVKSTRERLLTLFDRPGWGARTLRGLQDGGSIQGVDGIPFGKDGVSSRSQNCEVVSRSRSLRAENDDERWVPKKRPGLRRESMIRDKIRFFDGGMDLPSLGYNGPWELNGAAGADSSQSPTRRQQTVSPTKPGRYSVFPPKYHTSALTPVKSYGYLRPNETTPLPWRPLDSRRWEAVAHLTNSPDSPNVRGRPRERVQRSLITPNPTNATSAVKKVEITYQDPKRNVSEKVSVLYTTRLNERDEDHIKYEIQEKSPSSTLNPYAQDLSSHKTAKKEVISDESLFETKAGWETNGSKLLEILNLAKESKIQDRINLFSNEGLNANNFDLSTTRMRNQSTPTKLPSQTTYGTPAKASSGLRQPNWNSKPRVEKSSAKATAVTSSNVMASNMSPEADRPRVEVQAQKLAVQTPAHRKSSGISDKIQHFEAFTNGKAASLASDIMNKNRKWSSSQSKRIQTWPIPASDYVFNRKREQTMVLKKLTGENQIGNEAEGISTSTASYGTQTRNEKMIKSYQDGERTVQKIRSRQERLNRRSRSRSRSAPSASGPASGWDKVPRAGEHIGEAFGVDSRIEKRRKAAEEARQESQIALNVDLNRAIHQQHLEDGSTLEIWIDGNEEGHPQDVMVVDTVIAQCELAEPRPMRLEETLRMIRLCRGRVGERGETWRRKMGRSSEKGRGLAA